MEGGTAQSAYQPWTNQLASQMNLRVILEPKGFMKVLQFVFSIFAFATTSGFSTYVDYTLICDDKSEPERLSFSYPFRLSSISMRSCNNKTVTMIGDFSSQSEYFVATGVLAFLYCIGALILYVFLDKLYHGNYLVPIIDFAGTVVMAVFWLTASAAWAQGLTDFKFFSNPEKISCIGAKNSSCKVDVLHENNYATLNVSVIFGFLNFILWASNLWFLYKETPWFLARSGQPDSQQV